MNIVDLIKTSNSAQRMLNIATEAAYQARTKIRDGNTKNAKKAAIEAAEAYMEATKKAKKAAKVYEEVAKILGKE